MLWNVEWDKKPDPFTLDSLIMWLQQRNPDETYKFIDCKTCLLAQYFTAMGFKNVEISREALHHDISYCSRQTLPPNFDKIAVTTPHNFGAALERAKAMRPVKVI